VSWLEVLAVIGIIGFVIYQQLAGIPFAPEKDGSTFLGDAFGGHDRDTSGRY
jgi:hypothetical protein